MAPLAGCRAAPRPVVTLPARAVLPEPGQAQALYDRWAAALEEAEGPVKLSATEAELTALAAAYLADTPVERLTLWCQHDGQLVALALVNQFGSHWLAASLRLEAPDGRPRLVFDAANLDGRPIPRFVLRSLQAAVNDALTDAALPLRLERAILGEGVLELVVSGR
jgi:hypothetical protein